MSVNPAPAPVPSEPLANKAAASALGTVILVLLRWAVSGEFQLSDEGLITLAGAITSLAVYSVSNFRSILGIRGERGAGEVELLIRVVVVVVLLLLLVWVVTEVFGGDADAAAQQLQAAADKCRSSSGRCGG